MLSFFSWKHGALYGYHAVCLLYMIIVSNSLLKLHNTHTYAQLSKSVCLMKGIIKNGTVEFYF